jgi:hypothetical protein
MSRVQNQFPHIKEELIRYIKEEWEKIKLRDVQKYCTSARERCRWILHTILSHLTSLGLYIKYTVFVTDSVRFYDPCVETYY